MNSHCVNLRRWATLTLAAGAALCGWAADQAPAPSLADVRYGPFERNVLDYWAAPAASAAHPAPLVIYIHGGGWVQGDKTQSLDAALVRQCLDAGVSFSAINYRFRTTASLPEILRDCARAVQFLRSKAGEWHLDPVRFAAYGGSAGAGASLWLALHADLVDPTSADPVLRESSRLACAGADSDQFSYDFLRWHELFGDELIARYGKPYVTPALYGLATEAELHGPAGAKVRADCDLIGLMTRVAPPLFISCPLPSLALDTNYQFLHHPSHSERLYARARELGVPVVAVIPAYGITPPAGGPASLRDFFFAHLGVRASTTP